jgi:hypothetical protein
MHAIKPLPHGLLELQFPCPDAAAALLLGDHQPRRITTYNSLPYIDRRDDGSSSRLGGDSTCTQTRYFDDSANCV